MSRASLAALPAALGLAALLTVATAPGQGGPPATTARGAGGESALAALHARCVDDMLRQACRAMNRAEAREVPADGVVFVAGLGPVEASLYAELRESGDAMCDTVRGHCRGAWEGAPCRTARALYGTRP